MDAVAVLAVIREAFAEPDAPCDPPSGALRETVATIDAAIRSGGGVCAETDGMDAVVLWNDVPNGVYLGRLAVRPARRRQGLARALVEAAEQEARSRGMSRLVLGTRLVWHGNRRLFASLGFQETGVKAHAGYDAPTSVDMEKRL